MTWVVNTKLVLCRDGKSRRERGLAKSIIGYILAHGDAGDPVGVALTYKRVAHKFRTSSDYVRAACYRSGVRL